VLPWQWEIDHALNLGDATDMGTNDTLPKRQPAPAPKVYDIDGILTRRPRLRRCTRAAPRHLLHRVGSAGNYYSTAQKASRPRTTPSTKPRGCWQRASGLPRALPQHQLSATVRSPSDDRPTVPPRDSTPSRRPLTRPTPARWRVGFSLTQGDEVAYRRSWRTHASPRSRVGDQRTPTTPATTRTLMEPLADAVLTEQ